MSEQGNLSENQSNLNNYNVNVINDQGDREVVLENSGTSCVMEKHDGLDPNISKMIVQIVEISEDEEDGSFVEEQIKRVKQNIVYFILTLCCSVLTGIEGLYLFLGTMEDRDVYIAFPLFMFRIIFYPFATYQLCQNVTVLVRLFFMIDKILLALILLTLGTYGFNVIFLAFTNSRWLYISIFVLYPLHMFLFAGNFRVMMVYCEWNKVQVILFKVTLLIGSTSFFVLGMNYLVQGLRFTRGLSDKLDEIISNLLLIYTNAGFQFFLEMFCRMDSVDGTSDFKNDYKLHCDPEDMEALLRGREQVNSEELSLRTSKKKRQERKKTEGIKYSQIENIL